MHSMVTIVNKTTAYLKAAERVDVTSSHHKEENIHCKHSHAQKYFHKTSQKIFSKNFIQQKL